MGRLTLWPPEPFRYTPNHIVSGAGARYIRLWLDSPVLDQNALTLAEATLNVDLATWTNSNLNETGGETDPLGGNNAFKLTDTNDVGVPTFHSIFRASTGGIADYWNLTFWTKPIVGGLPWFLVGPAAGGYAMGNADTGAIGALSNATLTQVGSSGVWRQWRVEFRGLPPNTNIIFASSTSGLIGGATYPGTGTDTYIVFLEADCFNQTNVSAWANRAIGFGPASVAQATLANRPLYDFNPGPLGHNLVYQPPTGRPSCYLATNHADVLTLANGVDPSFALGGIGSIAGAGAVFCGWNGAGTTSDQPIYVSGANLLCIRNDAIIAENNSWGAGTAALVSAPCAWTVVVLGQNRYLYINGAYQATLAMVLGANPTMNDFRVCGRQTGATPETRTGTFALYAPGIAATHAAIAGTIFRALRKVHHVLGI